MSAEDENRRRMIRWRLVLGEGTEDTLGGLPAIAEVAVAGLPDPRNGNRLVAFVVRESEISAEDVIRHARSRLSVQKVPVEIAFVDTLPRSPTGKLLRAKLREL